MTVVLVLAMKGMLLDWWRDMLKWTSPKELLWPRLGSALVDVLLDKVMSFL
jgi:hypothetical protein